GYLLTPEWALELGYTDAGKYKLGNQDIKATSFGFGGAYHAAFNTDWSGVARFGIARNKAKLSGAVGGLSAGSTSKTKAYLGLGAGYALTKELTLTGTWDWTEAELQGTKVKMNIFSIGVSYAF